VRVVWRLVIRVAGMKEQRGWVRKATACSTAHSGKVELRMVFVFMMKVVKCMVMSFTVEDDGPARLGI
jgi:hypothetical protein